MGPEAWEAYTTTPMRAMSETKRPMGVTDSTAHANARGSRAGWGFHHASRTGPTWTLDDKITFTLPEYTKTNPKIHVETMRTAISETYHLM